MNDRAESIGGTTVSASETPEQHELRSAVRRFLSHPWPSAEVRRVVDDEAAPDPRMWASLAGQLGLAGLAVPEELGGGGAGVAELAIVAAELGRTLLPSPFLGSAALATTALLAGGDPAVQRELVPSLSAGDLTAALVVDRAHGRPDPAELALTATPTSTGHRIQGRSLFVVDAAAADVLLVVARTPGGPSLFLLDPNGPGVEVRSLDTLDRTRAIAAVTLRDSPGRLAGPEGRGGIAADHALDVARVVLAAEQLGGMEHCLQLAMTHVRERLAFGRPIGSFQAVRHSCVDMFLEVELARTGVAHAVAAAVEQPAELPLLASLAQVHCSTAYSFVASQTIHLLGGIGFTWEHDAQLYFKRAAASAQLLGDPAYHRARIATHLIDDGRRPGDTDGSFGFSPDHDELRGGPIHAASVDRSGDGASRTRVMERRTT